MKWGTKNIIIRLSKKMNIIIFFFEQTKMRYINKSFVPLAQEVPKETKQSYNKVPIKTETENNKSTSANP